mmetsp:Transcript_43773/g.109837  ORF Transcript_43773/g.109837 Transcript_43773/m.109837 type:complete len:691 (-) Transcript_43773:128-2200(-)
MIGSTTATALARPASLVASPAGVRYRGRRTRPPTMSITAAQSTVGPLSRPPSAPCPLGTVARPDAWRSAKRGGALAAATSATAAPWWAAQKELWREVGGEEEYRQLIADASKDGKLLVVDFYATWCHACQRVYPLLCLLAEDRKLRDKVVFAKMQIDKHKELVKKEGISALPYIRCYGAEGKLVFEGAAGPTKAKKLRLNLETALAEPGLRYWMDDTGAIQQETEQMVAFRLEKEAAAKAMAERAAAAASRSTPPSAAATPTPGRAIAASAAQPAMAGPKTSFLAKYKDSYGYGGKLDKLYHDEVGCRLEPHEHYMDYCAAALYTNSMIDATMAELKENVFGNPHSAAPSSVLTDTKIEAVRERILKYFNADPAEYQCVFTRGATASLKMVGEMFPWSQRSKFVYLRENHNSVLGQREYALAHGATFKAVDEEWVDDWVETEEEEVEMDIFATDGMGNTLVPAYNLFAFPGEDNFAGVKYPLDWVKGVQAKSGNGDVWKVMLDAAAMVHSNPLDLSAVPADFVSLSFYKMFGFPTGIGALLIRTENVELLDKVFWGGGSVSLATSDNDFHVLKCKPAERLEDGTISFLDIVALNHGFDFVESLGGVTAIQAHVTSLSDYLYTQLSHLRHTNGKPMAVVFGKHDRKDRHEVQGGIVNFELLGSDGSPLSYREVPAAPHPLRSTSRSDSGCC